MSYATHARYRYGASPEAIATQAEFVGQVTYVGPEPIFVSGLIPALQTLGMTITDVRRGELAVGDNVEVDVLVVAGNPHVGVGTMGLPALDASMVQPGALVVAWADWTGRRWQAVEISTDGPPNQPNTFAGRSTPRR